jgi:hypothetical protein
VRASRIESASPAGKILPGQVSLYTTASRKSKAENEPGQAGNSRAKERVQPLFLTPERPDEEEERDDDEDRDGDDAREEEDDLGAL